MCILGMSKRNCIIEVECTLKYFTTVLNPIVEFTLHTEPQETTFYRLAFTDWAYDAQTVLCALSVKRALGSECMVSWDKMYR